MTNIDSTLFHKRYKELIYKEEESFLLSSAPLGQTPFWKHWAEFTETLSLSGRSEHTIANVHSSLRMLIIHGGLSTFELWQDKTALFRKFHELRKEKKWSPATFNSHKKNANTYFIFLERRGLVSENPTRSIDKVKETKRNYSLPSTDEIGKFWWYLHNCKTSGHMIRKRNLLFFAIIMVTGMRPKEALDMTLNNVKHRDHLTIQWIKMGGKPRAYELEQWTRDLMTDYIREVATLGRSKELDTSLFLGSDKGSKWTYSWVRKFLDRSNEVLNFEGKLTCYSFRRYCATELFKSKIPLEQIAKYLGHSRTSTTLWYVQGIPGINTEAQSIMSKLICTSIIPSPIVSTQEY